MNNIFRKVLRIISISSGAAAIFLGLILLRHYEPQAAAGVATLEPSRDVFLEAADAAPMPETASTSAPFVETPAASRRNQLPLRVRATATAVIPWMEFDGVSILAAPVRMGIQPLCEEEYIGLPEFQVLAWTPDVISSGAFDVGKGTAVAWEHLGYTGLWMHSGYDWLGKPLSATPLQEYLEQDANGGMRTSEEFEQAAAECLVGSRVSVQVGEELVEGRVSAVVRIPSSDVETVSRHVMDLVPHLAETYPESGFDGLEAPELLLYFCGRQLSGETEDANYPWYAQSRIIVAIAP